MCTHGVLHDVCVLLPNITGSCNMTWYLGHELLHAISTFVRKPCLTRHQPKCSWQNNDNKASIAIQKNHVCWHVVCYKSWHDKPYIHAEAWWCTIHSYSHDLLQTYTAIVGSYHVRSWHETIHNSMLIPNPTPLFRFKPHISHDWGEGDLDAIKLMPSSWCHISNHCSFR